MASRPIAAGQLIIAGAIICRCFHHAINQSINQSIVVAAVPASLLITLDRVHASDFGSTVLASPTARSLLNNITPAAYMALFLLWEALKGPSSQWFRYIEMLPTEYNTPEHFKPAEMSIATNTVFVDAVARRVAEIDREHRHATALVGDICKANRDDMWQQLGAVSLQRFSWALSSVQTRCVHLKSQGTPIEGLSTLFVIEKKNRFDAQ